MQDHRAALDAPATLAVAVSLSVIAMAVFLVLPLFIGAAAEDLGLDARQVGLLSSGIAAGTALSSVVMMWIVRRVPWRITATLTVALMLLLMALSTVAEDMRLFIALQTLAALGTGSTYSLALTILSDGARPDRAFGYSIAAQVAFQVVGMLLFPHLIGSFGLDGLLILFVAMDVVALALVRLLPNAGRSVAAEPVAVSLFRPPVLMALGGCFFFFFNVGVVWTYIERMAVLAGFGPTQIGTSLAIGVAVGIPGALLASWCGDRYGRLGPLAVGAVGTVVAVILLGEGMSLSRYVLAAVIYNFVWNFSLAFQYATVNAVDEAGRSVAVAPAFHGAGATAGPALAALYVSEESLVAVNWLAGVAVLVSFALFAVALGVTGKGGGARPADRKH
jgi:predicted MFS family arabinose efflux permease